MTPGEIDAFLDLPLVGALALTRADGSPAVAPVWYRWDDATIKVWTDPAVWWVNRLAAESRVAFTVFEHSAPMRAIYIRGSASLRPGTVEELMEELVPITARYVGADKAVETVRAYDNGYGKVLVTITPTSVRGIANS